MLLCPATSSLVSDAHERKKLLYFLDQFFYMIVAILGPLVISLTPENETDTDDEKAMVKAIQTALSESTHVFCSRYLKQNVIHKLTDDAVNKPDRNSNVNKIFSTEAILKVDDTTCIWFD